MLTVLHTESSKGWGGQEQRTLRESIGLMKLGQRVIILCPPDAELGRRARQAGVEVLHSPMRKSFDIPAVFRIMKVIGQEGVDVVNTHSGRDSFLGGLAGRLSGRRPVIVRTRHLALPITSKISYSILPNRVVTVSEYVREYLIREGIDPGQVTAIPTGIDVERFTAENSPAPLRDELALDRHVPLVGTVAILRYRKGHHVLLEAVPRVLERFPEARFVFAGNGPQEENIRAAIASAGLERAVVMLGLRNDIPAILNSIDLFVLPTLQEALGTSFLEAMAMGKPVIGSAVDGVGEVIKDGVNGFLVPPGNPAVLAERIVTLLEDRQQAEKMGKAGKEMVERDFTVERMCERMLALYRDLKKGMKQ